MKKGFTLIELLAVIAVLAIILLIALPNVISLIADVKINAIIKDEEMLIKATKNYLSANQILIPTAIGSTVEVSLNDLQTTEYITSIKNPKDGTTCSGYVLVTKTTLTDYKYIPHLNCANTTINNSTADALLANYKFNDYVEPTVNYVPDGNFSTKILMDPYSNATNGALSIVDDYYAPTGGSALKHTATAGDSYTNQHSGITAKLANASPGEIWTFSAYVKSENGSVPVQLYLFPLDSGNTPWVIGTWGSTSVNATSAWTRISITFTMPAATVGVSVRADNDGGAGTTVYWNGWQLENKTSATTFTNGTRIMMVKDYSLGNNTGTNTSALGTLDRFNATNEAFNFNGTSSRVVLTDNTISDIIKQGYEADNWTLQTWIKPIGAQGGSSRILLARAGWHMGLMMNADRTVSFSMFDEVNTSHGITSYSLIDSKYYMVTGVYENRIMSLYINDALIGTNNFFNANPTVKFRLTTTPFTIGATADGTIYQYNGTIDEATIYGRALSFNEVKYIYGMEKTRGR